MTFLVWRRGLRGPTISKDTMDPRQSLDWKTREQETIQIVPLDDQCAGMHLATLEVLYPCPEQIG